eukprot:5810-Heterococcus_DN1.PRE.1
MALRCKLVSANFSCAAALCSAVSAHQCLLLCAVVCMHAAHAALHTGISSLLLYTNNTVIPILAPVHMKTEHGEVVPVEAVNAILLACCRLGDADRTFSTAAAIEKVFGVKKDLNSYNYLLHAAATIRKEEPPAAADSDDFQ